MWDVHLNPIVGYGTLAQFLSGLLVWNPQPSIEEVSAWVIYLLVAGWLFTGGISVNRPARPALSAAIPR